MLCNFRLWCCKQRVLWNGIYSGSNTMQQKNPFHLNKWLQICVFLFIVITLQKKCTRYLSKNSLKNISTVSFEIVDFPYSKLPPHFIKLDLNIMRVVLQYYKIYYIGLTNWLVVITSKVDGIDNRRHQRLVVVVCLFLFIWGNGNGNRKRHNGRI